MLYADKRALEQQLEVDLIGIRQKELDHYVHCCLTLSAPAALLAGFAYTALVQVTVPDDAHPITEITFYLSVIGAMVAEVAAVVKVTLVALCAPNLALRGPPGSMHTAVDAMRPAFFMGMRYFWAGLVCFHVSAGVTVWLNAQTDTAISLASSVLLLLTTSVIGYDIQSTLRTFHVPTKKAVDGKFQNMTASRLIHRLQLPEARREWSRASGLNDGAPARSSWHARRTLRLPGLIGRRRRAQGPPSEAQAATHETPQPQSGALAAAACLPRPPPHTISQPRLHPPSPAPPPPARAHAQRQPCAQHSLCSAAGGHAYSGAHAGGAARAGQPHARARPVRPLASAAMPSRVGGAAQPRAENSGGGAAAADSPSASRAFHAVAGAHPQRDGPPAEVRARTSPGCVSWQGGERADSLIAASPAPGRAAGTGGRLRMLTAVSTLDSL